MYLKSLNSGLQMFSACKNLYKRIKQKFNIEGTKFFWQVNHYDFVSFIDLQLGDVK